MTRKSRARLDRDSRRIPRKDNIASVTVDHKNEQIIFTTNDMLVKQIHRDGPRLARSFDRLTKKQIAECSAVFGQVQGLVLRHLSRLGDDDFKATSARLLASASNSLVASIEVARHGYRRQYGVLARTFIETVATVIAFAIKESALQQFHAGRLDSNKCVTWAKAAVPPIGPLWGMLSREFVHIGKGHSAFEPPSLYTADDEALTFIINSLRGNVFFCMLWLTSSSRTKPIHRAIGNATDRSRRSTRRRRWLHGWSRFSNQ
ncbi:MULTISPECIES: hypothetical protein [unclassified Mesorhizobium]|uniref:hypothetical protein n=1 Tax=unclassified Mesorhizobium TaxID=325217 RepID=UPI000FCC70F4|nr:MULTISPECIES: hypothetical protein [unclassified Mesorhizobium]TGP27966.1 hypothetical protein EN875_032930 [Mesorhizobium sp. M2D.F.Ca.ET.232.01.1.1]TGQ25555.1 hypothetical protein EN863_057135 [Mesorhizobium sp. M00.F.Ca.ET.220.01.1.1]TGT97829.1 hypothetical protein EN806_48480 [bacterium M00.F.Ca.ET.163.01.1.1]